MQGGAWATAAHREERSGERPQRRSGVEAARGAQRRRQRRRRRDCDRGGELLARAAAARRCSRRLRLRRGGRVLLRDRLGALPRADATSARLLSASTGRGKRLRSQTLLGCARRFMPRTARCAGRAPAGRAHQHAQRAEEAHRLCALQHSVCSVVRIGSAPLALTVAHRPGGAGGGGDASPTTGAADRRTSAARGRSRAARGRRRARARLRRCCNAALCSAGGAAARGPRAAQRGAAWRHRQAHSAPHSAHLGGARQNSPFVRYGLAVTQPLLGSRIWRAMAAAVHPMPLLDQRAAAEARRKKLLERGDERLQRITTRPRADDAAAPDALASREDAQGACPGRMRGWMELRGVSSERHWATRACKGVRLRVKCCLAAEMAAARLREGLRRVAYVAVLTLRARARARGCHERRWRARQRERRGRSVSAGFAAGSCAGRGGSVARPALQRVAAAPAAAAVGRGGGCAGRGGAKQRRGVAAAAFGRAHAACGAACFRHAHAVRAGVAAGAWHSRRERLL